MQNEKSYSENVQAIKGDDQPWHKNGLNISFKFTAYHNTRLQMKHHLINITYDPLHQTVITVLNELRL